MCFYRLNVHSHPVFLTVLSYVRHCGGPCFLCGGGGDNEKCVSDTRPLFPLPSPPKELITLGTEFFCRCFSCFPVYDCCYFFRFPTTHGNYTSFHISANIDFSAVNSNDCSSTFAPKPTAESCLLKRGEMYVISSFVQRVTFAGDFFLAFRKAYTDSLSVADIRIVRAY